MMPGAKSAWRAVWLVAALTAACGDDPSPTAGPTADQACMEAAQAVCDRYQACTPTLVQTAYGNLANCVARARELCVSDLAAPRTSSTPSRLQACATALRALTCADFRRGNPVTACQPVAGGLADGAPCYVSAQCQSTYCQVASNASCGACRARPTVGTACSENAPCGGEGLACSTAGTCQRTVAQGQPCGANAPCAGGLNCVMDACQPAPASVGATCGVNNACDLATGFVCGAAMTCQAIQTVAVGQPCGVIGGNLVLCVHGTCPGLGPSVRMGTCAAFLADGAACHTENGPSCSPGAACVPTNGTAGMGNCRRGGQPTCG